MKASVILNSVRTLQNDVAGTRWPDTALLPWLSDGQREVVKRVPTRFRARRIVELVAGPEQSVPAECLYLFGVVRNMGQDGLTRGASVRHVKRDILETFSPSWASKSGRSVKEYMQDDPEESTFLVNPPVADGLSTHVEIELAAAPADITDAGQDIGVPDRYETALVYWICHKIHAAETEEGAADKAAAFAEGFAAAVTG